MSNYEEWHSHAKYCSGQADQCATILELFNSQLTPELKEWLYERRTSKRQEAIKDFENAIQALKADRTEENVTV